MSNGLTGKTITRRELQARWGYSEIASARFGKYYNAAQPLIQKAQQKIPFEALSAGEIDYVATLNASVRKPLWACIPFDSFVCVEWTRAQLLQTVCVAELPWPFLRDYIAATPPAGDPNDPRAIALTSPFTQDEPVIVVSYNGNPTLFDGTSRSVLFLRSADPAACIMVWVPAPTLP
jgi:hypothetical protein